MKKQGITRRDFLCGTAVVGASVAAAGSLAGCSPTAKDSESAETPLYPEAEPIAPLDPPESWDDEADVIVVGTGGGGLAASLYCAEAGLKVITLEKQVSTGGATQHACGWFTLPGGSKMQNDVEWAYPEYPYDRQKFLREVLPHYDYTPDPLLIATVAEKGAECEDWIIDHGAPMRCLGPLYLDTRIKNLIQPAGMYYMCQDFTNLAKEAGADIRLQNEVVGLVMDNGAVVGVKVSTPDGERFVKAGKGVILCTGAFGMNKDMLAKYCPTAYRSAVVGGPFPWADGMGQRLAWGAGADIAGFDSFCAWEAYPERGDGEYWTFHWDGSVIACRQPWLTIDKMGNRCTYFTNSTQEHAKSFGGDGDYLNAATQLSRSGGREYVIMDANYQDTLAKIAPTDGTDRAFLTPERCEAAGIETKAIDSLCSLDWHDDWDAAVERGDIKKADTLEELAEQLGLAPDVLTKAVDDWNAMCERGVDDDPHMLYPYDPEWLVKLTTPPYYGAKIGGGIGKTFCGPRVNEKLQCLDGEGHVIPGLYAHFMTAGGIVGEGMFNGTMYNTTIQGGNAVSWISGYIAAQALCEEK